MPNFPWLSWRSFWFTTSVAVVAIGIVLADTKEPSRHSVTVQDEEQLTKGAFLYDKHCALCHGENGEGYKADNANALGNQDFLASVSDEFLWHSTANGRPGTPMAAHHEKHDGPLSAADISAVVAFIRNWQREATVEVSLVSGPGDATAGQDVFDEHCAVCHGRCEAIARSLGK